MADVSYWSGHMCGSGRDLVHSILVWVHTLGMLFWMATRIVEMIWHWRHANVRHTDSHLELHWERALRELGC